MSYQFGLIGFPIKHSLSPWIHTRFLDRCGLDGDYKIIEIDPKHSFADEMARLKASNIDGFNVTVPYKEKIIDYLDEVDEQAKQIGAVNTVLCKEGKWIGYNTDGLGYVRSLKSKYPQLTAKQDAAILIIGAGGAAKGIYYGLVKDGFTQITIANRTIEKALDIMKRDQSETNKQTLTLTEAHAQLGQFDIIIQTTSVGMKPDMDKTIIELASLKTDAIVSDIVYQPIVTRFLRQAKALDAKIHLGHTMLLHQAQLAFEIWTEKSPDLNMMDEALQQKLEGS